MNFSKILVVAMLIALPLVAQEDPRCGCSKPKPVANANPQPGQQQQVPRPKRIAQNDRHEDKKAEEGARDVA